MTLFLRLTRHSSCGLLATEALAIHLARLLATKVLTIHLTGGTAHIAGHSAHSVRARRACCCAAPARSRCSPFISSVSFVISCFHMPL